MATPSPYLYYPPSWETYYANKDDVPEWFVGIRSTHGQAMRFGARYRFAKSFAGISLKGVRAPTLEAYEALAHLLFTYGAFESFLKVVGLTMDTLAPTLAKYPVGRWLGNLRAFDPGSTVFTFIDGITTGKQIKRELHRFISGGGANFGYLAASVRHAFAHGHLTGSVWGSHPSVVRDIGNQMTEGLFAIMDGEWSELMDEFEIELDSSYASPDDEEY